VIELKRDRFVVPTRTSSALGANVGKKAGLEQQFSQRCASGVVAYNEPFFQRFRVFSF
jgi:hypothetical protein